MAGVKGRSGRKTMRDEEKRMKVIEKAWQLIELQLDSTNPKRFDVARDIVVKDITTHLKAEGKGFGGDLHITILRNTDKDKQEAETVTEARRSDFLKQS